MTTPAPSTTLHLSIDRLVLDGPTLAPHQLPLLLAALQSELTTLLADTTFTAAAIDRVRAPDLSPGTASDPTTLGRELARSLARTLGGGP